MTEDPDERTTVAPHDPLVGQVLARRYRVEQQLAIGGFGAVYIARDLVDRRDVAIKVVHAQHAGNRAVAARFRREAAALRRLNHRHTVAMYELGEADGGILFIAMELLHGKSLWTEFQAQGRLPWWRTLKIMRMVCSALTQAHALDIVHRDLKPENIHLERDGDELDFVKVVDFGIAKILRGSRDETVDVTHAGQMIGTFDYMAPEQMVGGEVGPTCDIFTLGIVIYEMISGVRPFGAPQTTSAMLNAILHSTPAPLSARAAAPRELDPIVARCLDRDPNKRYAYADELGADLERVMASVPETDEDRTETKIRLPGFAGEDASLQPTTLPGVLPPWLRR
ncbi:MAG TPA: serine/threonine-protein kinase [Kofleriaceae bacterium]